MPGNGLEFVPVTNPPFNDLDIDSHTIWVTFFGDDKAFELYTMELTLPQLAVAIGVQTEASKMELPWLKLQRFGDKRSENNCLRWNVNVQSLSGIEAEHDAGVISFETAVATMRQAGIRCLIYTSPSWVEGEKEKWRILAPLSRECGPEAHRKLVARINGLFKGAITGECFTLSQAYLFGHVGDAPHREVVLGGDFIDQRDDLEAGAMGKQKSQGNGADGASFGGGYTKEELIDNILRGEPLHESLTALAAKLAASGMDEDAIVKYLEDLMTRSKAPTDGRWRERFDDIPRLAASAMKFAPKPKDWTLLREWMRKREADGGSGGTFFSKPGAKANTGSRLILSSAQFVKDFVPPDYLWDGILLRGFVYSLTARTGDGKTAVALALTAAIALGKDFSGKEVTKGAVLYFAGENSDDVRMRWIAMAERLKFDADTIDAHFIPGVFKIPELEDKIRQEVADIGGVVLLIIDTSPAYFTGESENDRIEMRDHAEMTRRLHDLPGKPTVITLCHPVKKALNDNLVPAGGGAFINSMDGNLCAHRTDTLVTLHHQGKFRGVDFEPMSFELVTGTAAKLLDSRGRPMPTVIAMDLSKDDQIKRTNEIKRGEDEILIVMLVREGIRLSQAEIARALRWVNKKGEPNKSKVQRLMKTLTAGGTRKLVDTDPRGGGYTLTKAGVKAAQEIRELRTAFAASIRELAERQKDSEG